MSIKTDLTKAIPYGNSKIVAKGGLGNATTLRSVLNNIDTIPSTIEEDLGSGNIRVDFLYIDPATGVYKTVTKHCNKGDTMTAPKATDIPAIRGVCPALTFQEWNHDLSLLTNIQGNYCIGATYIPTDGWSWFKIRNTKTTKSYINPDNPLSHSMNLYKQTNKPLIFRVEDFDGNIIIETTHTDKYSINIPFTLPKPGDYWVKVTSEDIYQPHGEYSKGGIFNSSTVSNSMLISAFIGSNVTSASEYTYKNCFLLELITFPREFIAINSSTFFHSCLSLTSIVFPRNINIDYSDDMFIKCLISESISMPQELSCITMNMFNGNSVLSSIIIPRSVKIIGSGAFSCATLKIYDFTRLPIIPILEGSFGVLAYSAKIIVPDNLYSSWIVATNWSAVADYIISETDYNTHYGSR